MSKPLEKNGSSPALIQQELKLYEQLCQNIRVSDDISFKLLGLVPLISGSGAAILTLRGITSQNASTIIALSVVAAAITYGLFKWELRNVQKCDWFIECAAAIEEAWLAGSSASRHKIRQFSGWSALRRPPLIGKIPPSDKDISHRWYEIGKTQAERIIYWPSIAVWLLPIIDAVRKLC